MWAERQVSYSALFTYLVGWHAGAVRLPPADVIFTQLACPLNDVIFCLHLEQPTFLSTNMGLPYNVSKFRACSQMLDVDLNSSPVAITPTSLVLIQWIKTRCCGKVTATFVQSKRYCSRTRQNVIKFGQGQKVEFQKSFHLYRQILFWVLTLVAYLPHPVPNREQLQISRRVRENKQKILGVLFLVLAGMVLILINNLIIIYNNITN